MMKSVKTLLLACMLIPSLSAISFNTDPFFNYWEKNQEEVIELSKAVTALGGAALLLEYVIKKVGYNTTYSYLGLACDKVKSFVVGNNK